MYTVCENDSCDTRWRGDVIAVNCIDIRGKRNAKALRYEGGDAVLSGIIYEVWRYIMLLEKLRADLPRPEVWAAEHRIVWRRISGFHGILKAVRVAGRRMANYFSLFIIGTNQYHFLSGEYELKIMS